jgi:hypothetical protein
LRVYGLQVSVAAAVARVVRALAGVKQFTCSSTCREDFRISDDRRLLVTTLRLAHKSLALILASTKVDAVFGNETNMDLATIFPASYPTRISNEVGTVVDSILKIWHGDLVDLTILVNDWMPSGWEAAMEDILEPG